MKSSHPKLTFLLDGGEDVGSIVEILWSAWGASELLLLLWHSCCSWTSFWNQDSQCHCRHRRLLLFAADNFSEWLRIHTALSLSVLVMMEKADERMLLMA